MSLKNFIFSRAFFKNLGLALVSIVAVLMITMIWMNFYTRHGQAKKVPDFTGLTLEETELTANENKMRFQIIDSVYTNIVPRGCIADQTPKPGFKVKKWRNILLTINAFNPEMVAMPNLIDLPKRQALALIGSYGLDTGTLHYIPDLGLDVVIRQLHNGKQVHENDSLPKGSVIDLVLGKGLSNQKNLVPYIIGMKLNQAKNKILDASFNLAAFTYDNTVMTSKDTTNAFVFKQVPEFRDGATLPLGYVIYLWLTTDSVKLTFPTDTIRAGVVNPTN